MQLDSRAVVVHTADSMGSWISDPAADRARVLTFCWAEVTAPLPLWRVVAGILGSTWRNLAQTRLKPGLSAREGNKPNGGAYWVGARLAGTAARLGVISLSNNTSGGNVQVPEQSPR